MAITYGAGAGQWASRFKVTGQTVTGTMTPVLVITEANLPAGWETRFKNGGGDVRAAFNADGTSQLPCHVVTCDTTGLKFQAWVRAADYALLNRDVWLFGNNASAVTPAVTDPYGRNAVWQDDNIRLGTDSPTPSDISGNQSVESQYGTLSTTSTPAGLPALVFGAGDYVTFTTSASTAGDKTLSCWVRPDAPNDFATIISRRKHGSWQYQWRLESLDPAVLIASTSPNDPDPALSTGQWYHLALTISGSTISFYRDGVLTGTDTISGAESTTPYPYAIGNIYAGGSATIDLLSALAYPAETGTVKSADQISLEYNNQSDPATFWTTGAWEDASGGGAVTADISYSLPILTVSSSATSTAPSASASVAYALPMIGASASADTITTASASVSMPGLTVSASGDTITGASAAFTMPAIAVSASATVSAPGSTTANISATLPSLSASVAASSTIPDSSASIAYAMPSLTVSAAGGTIISAAITEIMPMLGVAVSAASTTPDESASVAVTMPQLSVSVVINSGQAAFHYADIREVPVFDRVVTVTSKSRIISLN